MKKDKYLKVKASLERMIYSDIFGANHELLEHRMYFVCDEVSKEMKCTWTINDTSMYEQQLLMRAIRNQVMFKLSENNQVSNFTFWLILRQAEFCDLAYSSKFIKPNTIYYTCNANNQISGPHYTKEDQPVASFVAAITKGILYVPAKRQLFEIYVNNISA